MRRRPGHTGGAGDEPQDPLGAHHGALLHHVITLHYRGSDGAVIIANGDSKENITLGVRGATRPLLCDGQVLAAPRGKGGDEDGSRRLTMLPPGVLSPHNIAAHKAGRVIVGV